MRGQKVLGTVLCQASTPRSYVVETSSGEVRRNHTHLRIKTNMNEDPMESVASEEALSVSHRPVTHSQTGTVIRLPEILT